MEGRSRCWLMSREMERNNSCWLIVVIRDIYTTILLWLNVGEINEMNLPMRRDKVRTSPTR
jgi:hypothetical protein